MDAPSTESKQQRKPKGWLRWFYWGVLAIVVLIVGDYIIEDIWGIYSWSKVRQELKTAGIPIDADSYIPAPIPDALNLAALTIFRFDLIFRPKPRSGFEEFPGLSHGLEGLFDKMSFSKEDEAKPDHLPFSSDPWQREVPDMAKVRERLIAFCEKSSPPIAITDETKTSEILSKLYPALAELRASNETHPLCQFKFEKDLLTRFSNGLSIILTQISVAKALALEGTLAIHDHNPELALKDFETTENIASGLDHQPLVISGLVCVGVRAIGMTNIRLGLNQHVWNDDQLEQIDADLAKVNLLSNGQYWLRGDFAVNTIPLMEALRKDRQFALRVSRQIATDSGRPLDPRFAWFEGLYYYLWSDGTFDNYLADQGRHVIAATTQMLDPTAHRVYRERDEAKGAGPSKGPENITLGPTDDVFARDVKQFAYAQAWRDEARIACRIERYRLAHGSLPETLDVLVPAYGSSLPTDVMTGTSYHYKVTAPDKYLLWSVGWNLVDDGGRWDQGNNQEDPDWVWTTYYQRRDNR